MEQAFGVLQAWFAIFHGPTRFWKRSTLAKIMKARVILHNMIIEDERGSLVAYNYEKMGRKVKP